MQRDDSVPCNDPLCAGGIRVPCIWTMVSMYDTLPCCAVLLCVYTLQVGPDVELSLTGPTKLNIGQSAVWELQL